MEKYMNMTIKDVMTEFPRVGAILNGYGIGCVTCSVGTCLLKDIIAIHNVPKHIETEMMRKIEAIINNEDTAETETENLIETGASKHITYSEPIQRLVDEHMLIKEFLSLVPALCDRISGSFGEYKGVVLESVNFIRQFADSFHHAKEEDILFAYAKGNTDIINVMLEDHKKGRYYVKSILLGLENDDASFVIYSLKHYRELLTEHIKKEDEILYPWIEKGMSESQIAELQVKFDKTELEFGADFYEKWKHFVSSAAV